MCVLISESLQYRLKVTAKDTAVIIFYFKGAVDSFSLNQTKKNAKSLAITQFAAPLLAKTPRLNHFPVHWAAFRQISVRSSCRIERKVRRREDTYREVLSFLQKFLNVDQFFLRKPFQIRKAFCLHLPIVDLLKLCRWAPFSANAIQNSYYTAKTP